MLDSSQWYMTEEAARSVFPARDDDGPDELTRLGRDDGDAGYESWMQGGDGCYEEGCVGCSRTNCHAVNTKRL